MASFIHIADKDNEQAILRNGIKATKRRSAANGVHAMPVVPNFTTTHQWARELRRWSVGTLIFVQFRIPDEETVLVGKYNGEKLEMTAAEAIGTVLDHTDPMGLEVIIPRKIGRRRLRARISHHASPAGGIPRLQKESRRPSVGASGVIVGKYAPKDSFKRNKDRVVRQLGSNSSEAFMRLVLVY